MKTTPDCLSGAIVEWLAGLDFPGPVVETDGPECYITLTEIDTVIVLTHRADMDLMRINGSFRSGAWVRYRLDEPDSLARAAAYLEGVRHRKRLWS